MHTRPARRSTTSKSSSAVGSPAGTCRVQESRAREAEAALAALVESRAQSKAEFQRTLYGDLVEAQRKAAGLREDVIKATQRTELQLLTSPVDGVVQQLAVHTVGGVVTPRSPCS